MWACKQWPAVTSPYVPKINLFVIARAWMPRRIPLAVSVSVLTSVVCGRGKRCKAAE